MKHQHVCEGWERARHPGRPRLLIEDPSPALEDAEFRAFTEAGFEVALCSGPDDGHPCPLVESGRCDLAGNADVVLVGLIDPPSRQAEVVRAYRRHLPATPVVVEVRRESPAEVWAAADGCRALYFPSSVDGQIRALWKALEGRS